MKTKRTFLSAAFKVFLALASFTGTIGFWSLLTNKDLSSAASSTETKQTGLSAYNLPSIPTIVPLMIVDQTTRNVNQGVLPSTAIRSVQAPAITNQATNPSNTAPIIIPTPVTSSTSSK